MANTQSQNKKKIMTYKKKKWTFTVSQDFDPKNITQNLFLVEKYFASCQMTTSTVQGSTTIVKLWVEFKIPRDSKFSGLYEAIPNLICKPGEGKLKDFDKLSKELTESRRAVFLPICSFKEFCLTNQSFR